MLLLSRGLLFLGSTCHSAASADTDRLLPPALRGTGTDCAAPSRSCESRKIFRYFWADIPTADDRRACLLLKSPNWRMACSCSHTRFILRVNRISFAPAISQSWPLPRSSFTVPATHS